MARHHHHVYVVALSDAVWNIGRFRPANPDYLLGARGRVWRLAGARFDPRLPHPCSRWVRCEL